MALANIHRPGALTPTVVLSLGLGITLLVTVIEIDGNLRQQFTAALPAEGAVVLFPRHSRRSRSQPLRRLRQGAGAAAQARRKCRCCAAASSRPTAFRLDKLKPSDNAAWVLQSDRGITYTGTLPKGSRLVEGKWWGPDYDGPPLISFEKRIADGLGLKLGDPVTVNVLGRDITARIANMRTRRLAEPRASISCWSIRRTPSTARRTRIWPRSPIPTAARRRRKARCLRAVADKFPMVTTVRVKEALQAIGAIVANLVLAIRAASAITLLAAALVLGGALAAGHRAGVYDAVILKTLGATRARLIGAYALEYLLLGAATALVRRALRLARRLADRHRADAPALCLAAAAGASPRRSARWW